MSRCQNIEYPCVLCSSNCCNNTLTRMSPANGVHATMHSETTNKSIGLSTSRATNTPRWLRADIVGESAIEFVVRSGESRAHQSSPSQPVGSSDFSSDSLQASAAPRFSPCKEQWDNPPDWRGGSNYAAWALVGHRASWALRDGHLMLLLPGPDELDTSATDSKHKDSTHRVEDDLHPDTAAVAMCVPMFRQQNDEIKDAAKDHGLVDATCGYCALAVAPVVADRAAPAMTMSELEQVLRACRDRKVVVPSVRRVMGDVVAHRCK